MLLTEAILYPALSTANLRYLLILPDGCKVSRPPCNFRHSTTDLQEGTYLWHVLPPELPNLFFRVPNTEPRCMHTMRQTWRSTVGQTIWTRTMTLRRLDSRLLYLTAGRTSLAAPPAREPLQVPDLRRLRAALYRQNELKKRTQDLQLLYGYLLYFLHLDYLH